MFSWVALVAAGCASETDDGSVTNDANEINEGRGALERTLDPQLDAPESDLIGATLTDVLEEVKGSRAAGSPKQLADCTQTELERDGKVVAEHLDCKSSDVVRIFAADGTIEAEHSDLDKDGKVDKYSSNDPSAAIAQLGDLNFDGTIDLIVERVDKVKDFSMEAYDEVFPKDRFLYRVREDRDRDGKLDHEKLTARGALPPAAN